jgi:hypothetical protein
MSKHQEAQDLFDKIKWRIVVLAVIVLILDINWWRP